MTDIPPTKPWPGAAMDRAAGALVGLAVGDALGTTLTGACFDIGATTAAALARFERARDPFAGGTDPRSAGNGSLMRVAPVALFALGDAARAAHLARLQSRLTHGAPEAVEACDLFVALLRGAIRTGDKHAVLAPRPWDGAPAIAAIAGGQWWGKVRSQIRSTGYVVDTLEVALWAVSQTRSFEDALVLAVNLGGDADTIGAVAGQLAGALYGLTGIPPRWLAPLAWRDRIAALAAALVSAGRRPRASRRPRILRPCLG